MAGVLSASLDTRDSEPNKKTYGSIDTNENNLGLTDSINGNLPMNHTSIGNKSKPKFQELLIQLAVIGYQLQVQQSIHLQ